MPFNRCNRKETKQMIDYPEHIELQDCPFCGGPAVLEEENGMCWYVMCADCGSQTAMFDYKTPEERVEAAEKVAYLWNIGKVLRACVGE